MFCVEHSSLKALLFGTTAEMVAEQHKGNSTDLKGSGFAEQLEPQCIGCYCGVRGGEGEGGGGGLRGGVIILSSSQRNIRVVKQWKQRCQSEVKRSSPNATPRNPH